MGDDGQPLWERAESRSPVFDADEVGRWPAGLLVRLTEADLLRPTADAAAVVCDACGGDHVEEVVAVVAPPGSPPRYYLPCPEAGRVWVPPERLRRWAVDLDAIAALAARLLECGPPRTLTPGRLWLLGRTALPAGPREAFLLRGTTWPDVSALLAGVGRLAASPDPLVLVLSAAPAASAWPGPAPRLLALPAVVDWREGSPALVPGLLDATGPQATPPGRPVEPLAVPAGATWPDVCLEVGEHALAVAVAGLRRQLGFAEAGFEDRRRGGHPDRLWALLRLFAANGGRLPYDATVPGGKGRDNLKQYVSELGRRLQVLVPLPGRPFTSARKARVYQALFRVATIDGPALPVPPGTAWQQIALVEVEPGVLEVAAEIRAMFAAPAAGAGAEAAEGRGAVTRRVRLGDLGLAGPDGAPAAAGAVLLALLRGGGRLRRAANDPATLALQAALLGLLPHGGEPLAYLPQHRCWSAAFEADSRLAGSDGHK